MVVSAVRFLVSWTLARSLDPDGYGAWVFGFSALLLAETLQAALVTWPLAVLAPARAPERVGALVSALAAIQVLVAIVCAAGLTGAAWAAEGANAQALMGAALAVVPMQLQEFCRRTLLSRERAGSALVNDLLLGTTAVVVFVVLQRGGETPEVGFRALAAGASVGVAWGGWQVRRWLEAPRNVAAVLAECWSFGRWILGSRLGEGLLAHASNLAVVVVAGHAAAAAVEAPRLLLAPVQVASFGILNVLLTRLTLVRAEGATANVWPSVRRHTVRWGGGFVAVMAMASLVAGPALRLAYGNAYPDVVVFWWWAGAHAALAARVVLSSGLYVEHRPDLVMQAMLTAGVFGLVTIALASSAWGARGAVAARTASEVLLLAVLAFLSWRRARERTPVRP